MSLSGASLKGKFFFILGLFTASLIAVLAMLVTAQNVPIDFAQQEELGNRYQRQVENTLRGVMRHQIYHQREGLGKNEGKSSLSKLQDSVDQALAGLESADSEIGEAQIGRAHV